MPDNVLPRIATLYQAIQRDRVGLERSLAEKPDVHDIRTKEIYEAIVSIETRSVSYLKEECAKCPVWPWLVSIKGIGPRLGGMMIGLIDIKRAPTVSSLWRFAGMAVIDGAAERPVKKKKLHYCAPLKKTMFLVERSFIMLGTEPYVSIYRNKKAFYEEHRPDWTPKRKDMAARRVMVKMFLSHLWVKWREAEGLPVTEPYAMRLPGHERGYMPPPEAAPEE